MKKLLATCLLVGGLPLFAPEGSRSRENLFKAIQEGNVEQVRNELKQGSLDLTSPVGGTGRSLLRHAIHHLSQCRCYNNRRDIVKALVNAGAKVGAAWKRAPEKGIYDIELLQFLTSHPTATNNAPASAYQLSDQVPRYIKDIISTIITNNPQAPERLTLEELRTAMSP